MKRAFDLVVSAVLMVVTLPIQGAIAVLVRRKLGHPVLFRQQRPGLNAQPFELLKFRTMTDEVDDEERPLPDEVRVTTLGTFLRRTSLDELPTLFNVVRGDMSLVGPRPLLIRYLPRYSATQMRRHEMRPGITGWAQVNGRNAISWEEKFALDVWYVDHQSFSLDMRILAKTLSKVIKREGIEGEGHVTMSEFMGSSET